MITNCYDPRAERHRLRAERRLLYEPAEQWTFSHHPSIAYFNGCFFAIWSNGRQDEDAPGQRVLVAVARDFDDWLEGLAPHEPTSHYRHNRTGEDNADAHLKRQVMGREVVVPITEGKLDFGPWEQIFYGEFDGRRRKRVVVKIIGE